MAKITMNDNLEFFALYLLVTIFWFLISWSLAKSGKKKVERFSEKERTKWGDYNIRIGKRMIFLSKVILVMWGFATLGVLNNLR